ncbi:hypothetical protein [Lentzea sp.]|uniref:hypothetical protein n=1 Tax=Lentzea sp. TaxID=56099 RepID=UPI002BBC5F43|nr:hypothetical protein [Lentzea sp.]HUQ60244.1 hypothetical protein [Lentzea sp.]
MALPGNCGGPLQSGHPVTDVGVELETETVENSSGSSSAGTVEAPPAGPDTPTAAIGPEFETHVEFPDETSATTAEEDGPASEERSGLPAIRAPHGVGQGRGRVELDSAALTQLTAEVKRALGTRERSLHARPTKRARWARLKASFEHAMPWSSRDEPVPAPIKEFNDAAVDQILGIATEDGQRSVIERILEGGIEVPVRVMTPVGEVVQNVVVHGTLGAGDHQRSSVGPVPARPAIRPSFWDSPFQYFSSSGHPDTTPAVLPGGQPTAAQLGAAASAALTGDTGPERSSVVDLHDITVAESDPAAWPERKTGVDVPALDGAPAPPAIPSGPGTQTSLATGSRQHPAGTTADDPASPLVDHSTTTVSHLGEQLASGPPVSPSAVSPRLPKLNLGKPFVEELFDQIDAKTSTAPRPVDLRDSVHWRTPDDTGPLTPDRLEQEFGVPKINQERFQNFVDRFNVVLDVRPMNPESVRWLYDGAMPKPKDLKAKTINQTDVLLGADPKHTGLVGFFQPNPPAELPGIDPALQEKVAKRFEERTAEFAELIGTMQEYEQDGKFKVVDGVVYGANSRGDFIWVAGDADMYGMYDTDGNRLGAEDYESMVFLLTNRNVGVQHGAHLYWDPVTDFDRKIFDTVVAKHVSDEPLVRFNPGQPPALVLAEPIPARVGANSEATPPASGATPTPGDVQSPDIDAGTEIDAAVVAEIKPRVADLTADAVRNAGEKVGEVEAALENNPGKFVDREHFLHDLHLTISVKPGDWHFTTTLPGVVASVVPRTETFTDQPPIGAVLNRKPGSLRRERERDGATEPQDDTTITARPFAAVELHKTLVKLFHPVDPPGPNGKARPSMRRAAIEQVVAATDRASLEHHLPEAMSADGYRIKVRGGPVAAVTIKLDLHDRELLRTTEGATPAERRHLVRARPSWDVTPTYRGKTDNRIWSSPLRSAHDGPIVLEVDDNGLADLGLGSRPAPVVVHGSEATHTPGGLETVAEQDENDPSQEQSTGGAIQPKRGEPGLPDEVREKLPDYLVDSLGMGESQQHSQVTIDESAVDRALVDLLPAAPTVLARRRSHPHGARIRRRRHEVQGLERVKREMKSNVSALLADGRRFPIKSGGRSYELVVKAKLHWDGDAEIANGKAHWAFAPPTKYRRYSSAHAHSASEPSFVLPVTVSAVPGMIVNVTPSFTTNVAESQDRDVRAEYKRAALVPDFNAHNINAHVSYSFELLDADEDSVGRIDHHERPGLDGDFVLGRPAGPRSNEGQGMRDLEQAPPKSFVLEELVVDTPEKASFFEQVARQLPEHLTKVGSHGRRVLTEFLHRSNIGSNLPGMIVFHPDENPDSGWKRSEPLVVGPVTSPIDLIRNGNMVEMRAVARQVEVVETFDGMYYLDWDSATVARTDTMSARRRGGMGGLIAAAQRAGAFVLALGVVFDFSHSRERSSRSARETAIRNGHLFNGKLVRYKTVYELQVRTLGHPPITLQGDLTGIQWTSQERALAAGLSPTGDETAFAPAYREGGDRTHFGPDHLESGLSVAGAKVEMFSNSDRIYAAIADTLRKVPGRRWYHFSSPMFIRHFDDPAMAAGLESLVNDVARRQHSAKNRLSDKQLMHLVDRMLGPGLVIPLVKQGIFHDYVVTVRIKATMTDLADGDVQLDVAKSTTETRVKDKNAHTYGTAKSTTVSAGLQGRLTAGLKSMANVFILTARAGRTWSKANSVAADSGKVTARKHGPTLTEAGALGNLPMRHFKADLTLTPTVKTYNRLSKQVRMITLGTRGRSAPAMTPIVLNGEWKGLGDGASQSVPVHLLVPEHLVTTTPPAPVVVAPTTPTALPDGTLIETLTPADRFLEGADVLSFAGTEHLVKSVQDVLVRVAEDPVFAVDDGENSELISEQFSPDNLRKDPRLFGKHYVEGLHYSRRRADIHGRVGVSLTPVKPTRLDPTEFQRTEKTTVGGTAVDLTGGSVTSVDVTGTNVMLPSGPVTSETGNVRGSPYGVVGTSVSPWGGRWGKKRSHLLHATEKGYFTGSPERKVLIKVGVQVEVVAETQLRGNIDSMELLKRKPVRSAGERFVLPDAVMMWVTEEQLARLEQQDRDREAANPANPAAVVEETAVAEETAATPGDHDLPAAESLDPGATTSLGIGVVDGPVDLSDVIADLRAEIAVTLGHDKALELLPMTSFEGGHDNTRTVADHLANVERSFNALMNGGVSTPIRLEHRFSGETYVLSVSAEWENAPTKGSVEVVRKLATRSVLSGSRLTEDMNSHTVGTFSVAARAHGHMREVTEASSQPNAGSKPASSGALGLGLQGQFTPLSRSHAITHSVSEDHESYAAIRGPVGSYSGDLRIVVKVERKLGFDPDTKQETAGTVVAELERVRPVKIRKMAEETLLPRFDGAKGLGTEHETTAKPKYEGSGSRLAAWRTALTDGVKLPNPGDYEIEHYLGKAASLRHAAALALHESGATVDTATTLALRAAITPAALKAGLPAMVEGQFSIPLPPGLNRDLEIHARLKPRPQLASASGRVEMDSSTSETEKGSVLVVSGSGYQTSLLAPVVNAGTETAAGQQQFAAAQVMTLHETPLTKTRPDMMVKASADLFDSSGREPGASHRTTHPDLTTRGLLNDVEFRIVARKATADPDSPGRSTGVVDFAVDNGYLVRMRDAAAEKVAGKLPEPLLEAVTGLATASQTWTDAVGVLDGAMANNPEAALSEELHAVQEAEAAWWAARREYLDQLALAQALERITAEDLARAQPSPEVELGVVRPVAAPPFLADVDQNALDAGQGLDLLRSLDLTGATPEALTPTAQPGSVLTGSGRALPKVVHVPLLGGPVTDDATWANLAATAKTALAEGWTPVLWTDVPRDMVVAARAGGRDLDGVRRFEQLAVQHGFVVVNADEVFNREAPMAEQDVFAAAMDNETDSTLDVARAVLGAELLTRFGGVVAPAEYVVDSTADFGSVLSGEHGFALGSEPTSTAPPVLVAPKGADFASRYGTALRRHVGRVTADSARGVGEVAHRTAGDSGPAVAGVRHDAPPVPAAVTPDEVAMAEIVDQVTETLVRGLRSRGDLDFAGVDRILRDHPRGEVVLEAAVAAIAARPAWRALLKTITRPVLGEGMRSVSADAEKWLAVGTAGVVADRGVRTPAAFHPDRALDGLVLDAPAVENEPSVEDAAAEIALTFQQNPDLTRETTASQGQSLLDRRSPPHDSDTVFALVREALYALRPGLANGVLTLDLIAGIAARHHTPAIVWRAAVLSIVSDPALNGTPLSVVLPGPLTDIAVDDPINAALDLFEFGDHEADRNGYSVTVVRELETAPQVPGTQVFKVFAFDGDTTRLTAESQEALEDWAAYLARAVLARHERGARMPSVTVEGGKDLGPSRRAAVAALLSVALDRQLALAQAGVDPSQRIGRGDVDLSIVATPDHKTRTSRVIVTVDGTAPSAPVVPPVVQHDPEPGVVLNRDPAQPDLTAQRQGFPATPQAAWDAYQAALADLRAAYGLGLPTGMTPRLSDAKRRFQRADAESRQWGFHETDAVDVQQNVETEAIATGVIDVLTPDGTRLLITDMAAVAEDYDAALDVLNTLEDDRASALVREAAEIVDRTHQPPVADQAVESPSESAYRQVHGWIVHAVAARLHAEQQGDPDVRTAAVRYAESMARRLGNQRGEAGSPLPVAGPVPLPQHALVAANDSAEQGVPTSDPRAAELTGHASENEVRASARGVVDQAGVVEAVLLRSGIAPTVAALVLNDVVTTIDGQGVEAARNTAAGLVAVIELAHLYGVLEALRGDDHAEVRAGVLYDVLDALAHESMANGSDAAADLASRFDRTLELLARRDVLERELGAGDRAHLTELVLDIAERIDTDSQGVEQRL